jgi:hypothetical protein
MKKIRSNLSLDELEEAINDLCTANIQEIDFNDIKRICDQLGCTYYEKGKNRKSGSAESFSHSILKDYPHFNGIVSIHLKQGGGSIRKVYKRNFVNYMAPGLKIIVKQLKTEKINNK